MPAGAVRKLQILSKKKKSKSLPRKHLWRFKNHKDPGEDNKKPLKKYLKLTLKERKQSVRFNEMVSECEPWSNHSHQYLYLHVIELNCILNSLKLPVSLHFADSNK